MEIQENSEKTYCEVPGFTHVTNEDILKFQGLAYKIIHEESFGDELNFEEKMTEGMLGVAKALETFDSSKGTEANWVAFNVRKSILDETRRSRRQLGYAKKRSCQKKLWRISKQRKENQTPDQTPDLASTLRDLLEEKKQTLLNEVMKPLNETERRCVQRLFFDSLTQKEFAQETGVSQSWVSRVYRRALRKMKENAGELATIYNLE